MDRLWIGAFEHDSGGDGDADIVEGNFDLGPCQFEVRVLGEQGDEVVHVVALFHLDDAVHEGEEHLAGDLWGSAAGAGLT